MYRSLAFFVGAWALVTLLTPALIALSRRTGFGLDFQNEFRKRHDGRICRLGGVPIFLAVIFGTVTVAFLDGGLGGWGLPVLISSTAIFLLGLGDDFRPLGARTKLVGQLAIAGLAYALGLRIDTLTYPGGGFVLTLGQLSLAATVLWLIAVPNIINLIDGFDGLATGIGILLACTLGIVALISQQWGIACVAFTLAGALTGFLQFNFPPARIFLGDGGAYFIGYLVATLSLVSENKASIAAALLVTFVALGLPILDTGLTILRRAVQGFPVFWGDRGHIHHRLQDLGLSKHRVLLGLYAVCVVLSLLGLSVFWSQGRTLPIAFGVLGLLAIFALRMIGSAGTFSELRGKLLYVLSRRKVIQYALLQGRVLALEVDRCSTPQEYWRLFFQTLRRAGLQVAPEGVDQVRTATLEGPGRAYLMVFADAEVERAGHVERVAECFRRPFELAVEKWPEAAPRRAGAPGDGGKGGPREAVGSSLGPGAGISSPR